MRVGIFGGGGAGLAAGYAGFFIDDHVPHTHGDTPWDHRGRAFANGYIQAMIEAVTKQSAGE